MPIVPRCTGLGFSPDQSTWRWTTPLITVLFFFLRFYFLCLVLFFSPSIPTVSTISGFLSGIKRAFKQCWICDQTMGLLPEEVFSGTENAQCKWLVREILSGTQDGNETMSVQCSVVLYTLGVHWKPRSPRQSGDMNKAILYQFFQLCITAVQLANCTENKFLDVAGNKISRITDVVVWLCHSNVVTHFQ